ncbi:MAG TPA: class I SAM-dependent methyltransferase [Candidatus Lustribacter sp.]|nr:class I SAM-dependent methyltransferase [Candidatus Lustribacter sp.]
MTPGRPGPVRAWWDQWAMPRLVDVVLSDATVGVWRQRLCADVAGDVLEVGFGSGRNLPFYGPDVSGVLAVEPSGPAWVRARQRVTTFARPVERIGLDGARIPLPDASVDAVVSTWTMCSIADLTSALSEMRRVLRPGGVIHFVEHSLAPDPGVARVQRALQPAWGQVSGGCHLDRDIPAELAAAGLTTAAVQTGYVTWLALAKPFGWFCLGRATAGPDHPSAAGAVEAT